MELGIVGLPQSGKTTVFNAVARGKAETRFLSGSRLIPNVGVVKVPDGRLKVLDGIFHPGKIVPAEIKYLDVPMQYKTGVKGEGISGQLLGYLSNVDAIIEVVRAFADDKVPHIEGNIDPKRDMSTLDLELTFSDLVIQERRISRINDSLKGASASDRTQLIREKELLDKIKLALEKGCPIREQGLTGEELTLISNYQFLTAKPILILVNIGEEQITDALDIKEEIGGNIDTNSKRNIVTICGKLEMELAELDIDEATEFRTSLGLSGSAVEKIIHTSYAMLGLVSFFTTVSNEVKAWTIHQGTTALKAAGKIHSDMERGFIRAEVIGYDDLVRCGSMADAKKRGLLRLEGKKYLIADGDVITFLFNI